MKITNAQLESFANVLEMLSPALGDNSRMMTEQRTIRRLKGNLAFPALASRVGRARVAVEPHVRALQRYTQIQLDATKIRPPLADDADVPPREQWPSDGRAFSAAMSEFEKEEIELGELKPLTWEILVKAGVVGGKPAGENECECDGSIVAALGDFLVGEPPDDVDAAAG